ncbi:helix-turn-helix domain-containing protein [uncultured Pseudokineococcus sp.]|uniref:helix-turn-helix domain-containing protein n=1 Tax=uncultured Pseudokineococcus sp. TaxID=1642928 RepID=UPI00261E7216|nr:helix-turn-helix domain-containing protein [uncultured Pseudokineococcus sp.]
MDEGGTRPAPEEISGLRVVAHPLRLQLLSLLTGSAMSAAEAARHLDQSQANVSYHLRRLHAAGLLEVAGHEVVRGGRAVRYRHVPSSGRRLSRRDPSDERALVAALGAELSRRTAQRDPDGEGAFSDAEVWVEEATWTEVLELVRRAGALLHEGARAPHADGVRRVSALLYVFEMLAGPAPADGDPADDGEDGSRAGGGGPAAETPQAPA